MLSLCLESHFQRNVTNTRLSTCPMLSFGLSFKATASFGGSHPHMFSSWLDFSVSPASAALGKLSSHCDHASTLLIIAMCQNLLHSSFSLSLSVCVCVCVSAAYLLSLMTIRPPPLACTAQSTPPKMNDIRFIFNAFTLIAATYPEGMMRLRT